MCTQSSSNPRASTARDSPGGFYHLPMSRPPAQTRPPPPTGNSITHTPISHSTLRVNRRRWRVRSFRWSSSSLCESLLCRDAPGRGVVGGIMMERGRRKLWTITCRQAAAGVLGKNGVWEDKSLTYLGQCMYQRRRGPSECQ
jgi:hypothetical protein